MQSLWRSFLKAKGWNTELVFPYHHIPKYIIIVAPHTSNWDFVIGLAYRNMLSMNRVRFLGKKELFKFPYGWIFRSLGGIPVDRSKHANLVDQVVDLFNRHEKFCIALAPEGTRKKVEKLKTGFYFIADKARVPIIMVGFDYVLKTVKFSAPFNTSGNVDSDFETIYSFYRGICGRHPENGLMHK